MLRTHARTFIDLSIITEHPVIPVMRRMFARPKVYNNVPPPANLCYTHNIYTDDGRGM